MKIYRVAVAYKDTGKCKEVKLHTSYQSAAQSKGYWERQSRWYDVELTAVTVAEDAWLPVDPLVERRLRQVEQLWLELSAADAAGLDALLADLLQRAQPVKKAVTLSQDEKTQAQAALDRLVS